MALKRKIRGVSEIDVTSFSDIAFLLIIFFILTTSMINLKGQQLKIPSGAPPKEQRAEDKALTINLKPDDIRIGEKGEAISLSQLRRRLFEAKFDMQANDKDRAVILEAAGDVSYDIYFKVSCAITEAGGILTLMEMEDEK